MLDLVLRVHQHWCFHGMGVTSIEYDGTELMETSGNGSASAKGVVTTC